MENDDDGKVETRDSEDGAGSGDDFGCDNDGKYCCCSGSNCTKMEDGTTTTTQRLTVYRCSQGNCHPCCALVLLQIQPALVLVVVADDEGLGVGNDYYGRHW